ncbi:hypothetical protein Psch_01789 [Pelotomaculum schinkii]|uniref:Uncharacterized protein n=1 Tax=Pelotomaculum schinkii TaxID=78350 RepID=A0A4Y7RGV7_9FIRM|nr:hypothetical protein Psch_01789 [Pelotomaculum schinkii]
MLNIKITYDLVVNGLLNRWKDEAMNPASYLGV